MTDNMQVSVSSIADRLMKYDLHYQMQGLGIVSVSSIADRLMK